MPGTRKLGKTTDQRMAMLRQQVTDLLDKGRMETTVTRAKEIAPMAEKMISLGKKKDLAAYRQALAFITREDVAKKTFDELSVKYADRNGGYTRRGITPAGSWRTKSTEIGRISAIARRMGSVFPVRLWGALRRVKPETRLRTIGMSASAWKWSADSVWRSVNVAWGWSLQSCGRLRPM